eukprot:Amastigsp_a508851_1298.p2 type:complete len:230 gc:universal Amastigsp_a508851_1298:807-118(-)
MPSRLSVSHWPKNSRSTWSRVMRPAITSGCLDVSYADAMSSIVTWPLPSLSRTSYAIRTRSRRRFDIGPRSPRRNSSYEILPSPLRSNSRTAMSSLSLFMSTPKSMNPNLSSSGVRNPSPLLSMMRKRRPIERMPLRPPRRAHAARSCASTLRAAGSMSAGWTVSPQNAEQNSEYSIESCRSVSYFSKSGETSTSTKLRPAIALANSSRSSAPDPFVSTLAKNCSSFRA